MSFAGLVKQVFLISFRVCRNHYHEPQGVSRAIIDNFASESGEPCARAVELNAHRTALLERPSFVAGFGGGKMHYSPVQKESPDCSGLCENYL